MAKVIKLPSTPETKMRLVLSGVLFMILAGMIGGFVMAYSFIGDTATEVSRIQSEAAASDAELQQIRVQQQQMEKYRDVVDKAEQIVAESKQYQYQNQIIEDLTRYAKQAKLEVRSFDFAKTDSTAAKKPAAKPASPKDGASQPPAGAPKAQNALKSITVEIQLGNNPSYTKMLHFMYLIEQNLTRMQIASLNISRASGDDSANRTQNLTIEVYIK
ncbi:hypothetical protein CR969_00430 [Candidatus Saccharibacteria bacterium]|nr:MAG: hypothetical protein CR969_00430 [Candidatus Saccharibacteria bacterium]